MNFDRDYTMTIGGRAVSTAETEPVVNPATEEVIAYAPAANRAVLDEAVAAAREAFPAWSARPIAERQSFLRAIGERLKLHKKDLMRLLTLEQGKPRAGADWELTGTIIWCHETATHDLPVHVVEDSVDRLVETRHVPIGVVGAITPWNYPVLLALWKILPALLAGNTMVVKPSPYTPLTTLKIGEMLRDILPAGVLNIVSGGDKLGKWITEHAGIGKISFTGSTQTGKRIMESASGNLKRITLELGGNDAAIVMPDVDPKAMARELFWAAFQNSAQLCVATKRLYIHADVYDELAAELVEFAKTMKVGDGAQHDTDLGPIQNRMQFEKVKDLLADARNCGHKFLLGGDVPEGKGYFVPVAIVDNPPEDSRVVVEEAFGPVLPLLKFDDVDDVVARANNSIFGLGGSVWSSNLDAARKIAERLECGTVWINEIHAFSPHATFAGHKQSGIGVENAVQGLLEFTNAQTIVTKRVPA
ncbi:aldehyde dehydrogenase family protein [Paraburkholderia phenoliruptrix]|uniref:aldehyde dehydrogenase family protein n=1 Tax=Paraburkholderia phenoliruptrix TaxID=252970 RepID=UPI002869A4C3|nr:aldehyde dehydrogenase family protein [Paraburkholderia phenoliruptrix]WMY09564.1 aldehyde dehydrogenase family protein [Paraburkholderia phenoliruptrix]